MIRFYSMTAKKGEEAALIDAISALSSLVRALEGCTGVQFLSDVREEGRFYLLEEWISADAHKAAAKTLSAEDVAPMIAAIDKQVKPAWLESLISL